MLHDDALGLTEFGHAENFIARPVKPKAGTVILVPPQHSLYFYLSKGGQSLQGSPCLCSHCWKQVDLCANRRAVSVVDRQEYIVPVDP